jgi:hypothetical protein
MASANDILSMDQTELVSRKKSLTKNDLFDAILQLKSTMSKTQVENIDSISLISVLEAKLKERLDPFLEKVAVLTDEISALKCKTDVLERRLNKLDNMDDSCFNKMFDELSERSRREKNIIISGIEEPYTGTIEERRKQDTERTAAVLLRVGSSMDSVVDLRRLGKPGTNGGRLLRVTLESTDAKFAVLKNAKLLREGSDFRKVYVNNDRTKMQQAQDKALREEVKRRRALGDDPVIQRGKIVDRSDLKNFQGRF